MKSSPFGSPTYFEILVVLTFFIFYKRRVDYTIVETGLGGLYDATNTVDRADKFVILTRIGLDHREILGKTIDKIAFQKAKIIQSGNQVISIWQKPQARNIIQNVVDEQKAKIIYVRKNVNFRNIGFSGDNIIFDFHFRTVYIPKLKFGFTAEYQVENASLA